MRVGYIHDYWLILRLIHFNQNYTQNIDTLETLAGVQRVLQCHGSFATASCLLCRRRVPGSEIEVDILRQKVALCTVCNIPAATKSKKKKGRKKSQGKWDSNDEDESDQPQYPPGIMKVGQINHSDVGTGAHVTILSPISRSLVRSLQTILTTRWPKIVN